VPDRQLTGYRNARPMALKPAVAGAGCLTAAAGWALMASAHPLASATATVIAASVIASRFEAIMAMRRVPAGRGSVRHLLPIANAQGCSAVGFWC
jgi:hypothetical protein